MLGRARRPAPDPLISRISDEGWAELELLEQGLLFALDDFERGRFDQAELRRRLGFLRKLREPLAGRPS